MFWYVYGVVVVIVHTPLFLDVLRFACPDLKLSRIGYWSRYILIVGAPTVGFTALWQLLCVFLPLYEPEPLHTVSGILHIVFIVWIAINITVNYYRALLTHPGVDKSPDGESVNLNKYNSCTSNNTNQVTTPLRSSDVRNRNGDQLKNEISQRNIPSNGMQWYPGRGNYCKICRYRVAYLDHHCPYIGICFGINNYSYFYIGIFYGLVAGIYAFILTAPYFWKCDIKYLLSYLGIIDRTNLEMDICDWVGTQSRAFIPVIIALWLVGMMFVAQNILLFGDVSTYNVLKNAAKVPMLSFIGHRMRGKKFLHPDSRLNILILSQRRRWFHYLIPVGNSDSISSCVVHAV